MGRPDAAGGEYIGVFGAQTRSALLRSPRLVIGTTRTSFEVDANRSEVIGDIADVLSLVRPERISSPITSTAAVMMSGLALMALSLPEVQ